MKFCPGCHIEKPTADYFVDRRPDGMGRTCKACRKAYVARWRERRPELYKASQRRSTEKNARRNALRVHYGLTPEDVARLLAAQGGRCCGCDQPLAKPFVDHDHRTGVVRGLLCHGCNLALGHVHDDPDTLFRLVTYLRSFNSPSSEPKSL